MRIRPVASKAVWDRDLAENADYQERRGGCAPRRTEVMETAEVNDSGETAEAVRRPGWIDGGGGGGGGASGGSGLR